ncbi:MAG: proteinase inhibitor [Alphaproteobacteria bacterium]|nr:proteinase inhibitor [Alphaproteobacteria bacterium]MCB9791473.1 proteinase inhibitor [Alphaproteobacteria bacterium]
MQALLILLAACSPELDPNATEAIAHCTYINPFPDAPECREYLGSAWTDDRIVADCAEPMRGTDPGMLVWGEGCDTSSILGQCFIDEGTVEAVTLSFPGEPGDSCDGLQMGCGFAGGEYAPAAACGGEDPPSGGGPYFTPFEQVCMDPLPGEPAGEGPDGQVCTWSAISASTEEGRSYADYADCDAVLTQRPYYGYTVDPDTAPDDPRYEDAAWMAEYDWVTAQVEASACVCCHTESIAPEGPSGWYIDSPGLWTDALDDEAMAMMAGWIDSSSFGAFDPADNNGFSRDQTGTPTTDPARMEAFWAGELARRGKVESDFVGVDPFGGPLAAQAEYRPSLCQGEASVDVDGRITWMGGRARYLYVAELGTANVGVPPNRDLPEGTMWRVDAVDGSEPFPSGVVFGALPEGGAQVYPEAANPAPLVSGQRYYLTVLYDIAQPLARCLFVMP